MSVQRIGGSADTILWLQPIFSDHMPGSSGEIENSGTKGRVGEVGSVGSMGSSGRIGSLEELKLWRTRKHWKIR